MKIKGWIKNGMGWYDEDLYIVSDKDKKSASYVNKLSYMLDKFQNKFVICRYAVKNVEFEDITEELINQIYGDFKEDTEYFRISEMTSDSYNFNTIGGHNLTQELKSYDGKFVIIEIKEIKRPEWIDEEEDD